MKIQQRISYISKHIRAIGWLSSLAYFIARIVKGKGMLLPIRISGLPHPVWVRNKTYDIHIFYQLFIAEELDIEYDGPIKNIVDCGANIGLSSLYYQYKFPGVHIIAIEPDTDNYTMLEKNTAPYKNIKTLQKGIYGSAQNLYLVDTGEGEAAYRVLEHAGNYRVMAIIPCISINELLADQSISRVDILKMDIEGSEYSCLLSQDDHWIEACRYILVEFHDHMYPEHAAAARQKIAGKGKLSSRGEYTIIERPLIHQH